MSALTRFAGSAGYQTPQAFAAQAALENYGQWQQAGKQAHGLLVHGIDLGLSGDVLRPVYQEIVALWRDAAGVAEHALASLRQATGEDHGVAAPISSRSADYPIGVTLLSLATLLDVQEAVPALVEQVLAFDTDQLLDYLSAGALELEEVSETLYHPRPYGALRPFFEQVTEALPEPLLPYLHTQYLEFFQRSPQQPKKRPPVAGHVPLGAGGRSPGRALWLGGPRAAQQPALSGRSGRLRPRTPGPGWLRRRLTENRRCGGRCARAARGVAHGHRRR